MDSNDNRGKTSKINRVNTTKRAWIIYGLLILAISVIYYSTLRNLDEPDSSERDLGKQVDPFVMANSVGETLSAKDNGYKWKAASNDCKISLCQDIARRTTTSDRDWRYYYDALNAFFDSSDPYILNQQIVTITAMAATVDAVSD